ncbi:MAG: glycosyltransferase family 4 protein [Parcubacteria group bacterium]|nr:glycosyltransferase family 4 protein [Parcubacteria group bacterium]
MKIIYIANTQMPTDRAHGYQIGKTCEKFAVLGNDVSLVVPDRQHNLGDDIFEYYGLKRNFAFQKISCFDVMSHGGRLAFLTELAVFSFKLFFIKTQKDTIIYSRDIISLFVFRMRGFCVVYNVHNWSKRRSRITRLLLGRHAKIVCNSEGTRRQVMKSGFKNSITAQNGVELSEFENKVDQNALRQELHLPLDKKIAMYVGHLYDWKGVDTVLGSAKLLGGKKGILFVIIGGDEGEQKEFTSKMKEEGIKNMFSCGNKPKREIPKYLQSADILLLPNSAKSEESVKYTSPIKMFEYLASGVPVVASNLPSLKEVLNEKNSLLVEPDSPQALADGIEKLLNDTTLSETLARQAKADVQKYTWDEYARKILNFIYGTDTKTS